MSTPAGENTMSDFAERLAALRPALVRAARQRVHNEAWAEDAVSETLVAALENPAAFAGRAQLRTWLVGILKHKLVDQLRRHGREQAFSVCDEDDALDDHDHATPLWGVDAQGGWADPQDRLLRRQFIQQLGRSLESLPVRQSRAFLLRECLEVDADDVCRELGVTANNLAVMLHRARRHLRDALLPAWTSTASAQT
jgi:RNA polymerase sigma-70 factor (TIGR02943 family)